MLACLGGRGSSRDLGVSVTNTANIAGPACKVFHGPTQFLISQDSLKVRRQNMRHWLRCRNRIAVSEPW